MDRLATSLLLYVLSMNLVVSAVTHLMPLMGGRELNPLPAWAGEATFLWELAFACLIAGSALLIQPAEERGSFRSRRGGRSDGHAG